MAVWLQEELNVWHASSVHLCLTINRKLITFYTSSLIPISIQSGHTFQEVELQILCLVQNYSLYLPQTEEGLKNGEETVDGWAPGF